MISIFVAKLDFGVSNEELKSIFEKYGKVLKATVATDRETGKPRGFAFVEMQDAEEAQNAIDALDQTEINGREIAVKRADDRGPGTKPAGGAKPSFSNDRDNSFKPRRESTDSFAPPKRDDDSSSSETSTPIKENRKFEPKKEKVKLESKSDSKKVNKMEAYKKSGKNNRFFAEDEDDEDFEEFDLFGRDQDDADFDSDSEE